MMDSGKKKIFGLQFLVNILLVMDVVVLVAIREVTASMDGDLKLNEIIHSSVSVMITPVKILRFNSSTTTLPPNATADYDKTGVYCSLTIHRNDCGNPRISYDELITWDTRVCFRWNCARVKTAAVPKKGGKNSETTKSMGFQPPPVKDFAIRVQNCWTGSPNEPIFLIDKNGCSQQHSMISAPIYEYNLKGALAHGYLSVRLVGMDSIILSCTVLVCDVCDEGCSKLTPPKCPQTIKGGGGGTPQPMQKSKQQHMTIFDDESSLSPLRNVCMQETTVDVAYSAAGELHRFATWRHHRIMLFCVLFCNHYFEYVVRNYNL